mgnify:FL=1
MSAPLSQHLDNTDTLADPLPALGMPGLLVMDVDSTLIDEEVIDELGEEVGVGDEIAAITARAMNGELDFRQALDERVALLRGMPAQIFDRVYERLHFTMAHMNSSTRSMRMAGRWGSSQVASTKSSTGSQQTRISITTLRTDWAWMPAAACSPAKWSVMS